MRSNTYNQNIENIMVIAEHIDKIKNAFLIEWETHCNSAVTD